jgi:hypothetical protein
LDAEIALDDLVTLTLTADLLPNKNLNKELTLVQGVPQGASLAPLLFPN